MAGPFDHIEEVFQKNRYDYIEEVRKFNPYHDRFGRFASAPGGGASIGMGVDGSAGSGKRNDAVAGTLQQVEKANKDLDHEVATIVDAKTGKVIFSKDGGKAGVSFNRSEQWEIKGQVMTHNHPDDAIFSPADVAMAYHVDTIRATTPSGTVFELKGMTNRNAVLDYQQHYMSARSESFKKLGIPDGTYDRDLQGSQRSGSFSYISDSCDKWLSDNASKYGYQYRKGSIDDEG